MVTPELASVRPRVVGSDGQRRPLEDVVDALLAKGITGVVVIVGPPGSGKSTAICHMAATLALRVDWRGRCRFEDRAGVLSIRSESPQAPSRLTIATACDSTIESPQKFTLAGWNQDDLIEYLLSRHPAACAFVMPRVTDGSVCDGLPLLWSIALEHLVEDQSLPNVRSALSKHVDDMKIPSDCRQALRRLAWMAMTGQTDPDEILTPLLARIELSDQERFFLMEPIQCLMACEHYVSQLRSPRGQSILQQRLPNDLLPYVANELRFDHEVIEQLQKIPTRKVHRAFHAAAATLLVAIDPSWRPPVFMHETNLQEATLNGVDWSGIDLSLSNLNNASLNDADLSHAKLFSSTLHSASLRRANLQRASLTGGVMLSHADASGAQFQQADLTEANLDGAELDDANFDGAVLKNAWLRDASLSGTSFRNAILSGAVFAGSSLDHCDFTDASLQLAVLDGMDLTSCCFDRACLERALLLKAVLENVCWPGVVLRHAILRGAYMTGSQLHHADLRWADLTNAGLGDIDWENADLRHAKLTGVTFHMGSSRGGLVFSPIACEGSKTGFYTDDLHEQHFKAPEEIRKANLRGADLRGANIKGVDFYLVDLRYAKLDADQLEYVKSSGAILTERLID